MLFSETPVLRWLARLRTAQLSKTSLQVRFHPVRGHCARWQLPSCGTNLFPLVRWVVPPGTLSSAALVGTENTSKQRIQHPSLDKLATTLEGMVPATRKLERLSSSTTPLVERAATGVR